jgi:outer membrane protein
VKRRALVPLALLAALGSAAPARAAGPDVLGIEDVARLALTNVDLQAARERANAALERSRSVRGRLLPSVHVGDEYQHWDKPFAIPFGATPVVVRNLNSNSFSVSARQPILGLLRGSQEYSAASSHADVAAATVRQSESELREAVELVYLQLFEAKARVDIARTAEQELAQEVSETEARVKAGTLTNADLLRVQVAQATARQQGIAAEADATVARATLLTAIGRSPDDAVTQFVPPTALLARAGAPLTMQGADIDRRPDVQRAKLHAEATDHDEQSRLYGLLPEIDLEAAYLRTDGQKFAPPNSAFVGVKADWAIWEWGASYAAKEAAAAEARAAARDAEGARRRALNDVAGRKAELGAATSVVALAQQTIASAQEAYRVTEAQVRAGAGTTTDLLNAESALSEARLRLENARYRQAAAHIRLERALGAR